VTQVSRSLLLPYSAREMFDLVNEVARYPEFLPFCSSAEVLVADATEMQAALSFSRMGLEHALRTRNRLTPPGRIEIEFVSGPFEYLRGEWTFQALGEGACKTAFSVEFQLQARFLQFAATPAINQAVAQAVEAFQRRAVQVYGKR
jgi:ribosome-associated toxin RatA of RatAB toxin-antitoxin module